MATYIYDLEQVACNLGPIFLGAGFGEGGALKITFTESFTKKEGAMGDVTRSKTNSKMATLEITLGQASPLNAALSALLALDEGQRNGAGLVDFRLADLGGLSVHSAEKAWISKRPDADYQKESTDRVWMVDLSECTHFIGGNG